MTSERTKPRPTAARNPRKAPRPVTRAEASRVWRSRQPARRISSGAGRTKDGRCSQRFNPYQAATIRRPAPTG